VYTVRFIFVLWCEVVSPCCRIPVPVAYLQLHPGSRLGDSERRTDPQLNSSSTFLKKKVVAICQSISSVTAQSTLPLATITLDNFDSCTIDDVKLMILSALLESCALCQLSTSFLKEFLSELLPFLADCATDHSLRLPTNQPAACYSFPMSEEGCCQFNICEKLLSNI